MNENDVLVREDIGDNVVEFSLPSFHPKIKIRARSYGDFTFVSYISPSLQRHMARYHHVRGDQEGDHFKRAVEHAREVAATVLLMDKPLDGIRRMDRRTRRAARRAGR